MDNEQESIAVPEESIVTVLLTGLEDVEPQYVNVVHATNNRDIFQIIFSQATPPVLTKPEDSKELIERGTIPGRVIARLLITPSTLDQVIDVLQTQARRYREIQRAESDFEESIDG